MNTIDVPTAYDDPHTVEPEPCDAEGATVWLVELADYETWEHVAICRTLEGMQRAVIERVVCKNDPTLTGPDHWYMRSDCDSLKFRSLRIREVPLYEEAADD